MNKLEKRKLMEKLKANRKLVKPMKEFTKRDDIDAKADDKKEIAKRKFARKIDDADSIKDERIKSAKKAFKKTEDDVDSDKDYKLKKNGLKEMRQTPDEFNSYTYMEKTQNGWEIQRIYEDVKDGRLHIIVYRPNRKDYAVGIGYNPDEGYWNQGWYDFETLEDAVKALKSEYRVREFMRNVEEGCTKKSIKESKKLNESLGYGDISDDAIDMIRDGYSVEEAIDSAIDNKLIYSEDIWDLARYYGNITDDELRNSFIEELYDDVYRVVDDRVKEDTEYVTLEELGFEGVEDEDGNTVYEVDEDEVKDKVIEYLGEYYEVVKDSVEIDIDEDDGDVSIEFTKID